MGEVKAGMTVAQLRDWHNEQARKASVACRMYEKRALELVNRADRSQAARMVRKQARLYAFHLAAVDALK